VRVRLGAHLVTAAAGGAAVVGWPPRNDRRSPGCPYLERRDPQFKQKMAEVLCAYREVKLIKETAAAAKQKPSDAVAILSYDAQGSRRRLSGPYGDQANPR
jgi:hypothetical protein